MESEKIKLKSCIKHGLGVSLEEYQNERNRQEKGGLWKGLLIELSWCAKPLAIQTILNSP
jgi:hypothetical protein